MKNYIWVIEFRAGGEWHGTDVRDTRQAARWAQKVLYSTVSTRIRKYVPA